MKADENEKALGLLKEVLDEIDSFSDPVDRFQAAVQGVFAGNVFDLGAPKMVALAAEGVGSGEMFMHARATLAERPWAVDKLDELRQRMGRDGGPAHKKAIVFADNAGASNWPCLTLLSNSTYFFSSLCSDSKGIAVQILAAVVARTSPLCPSRSRLMVCCTISERKQH